MKLASILSLSLAAITLYACSSTKANNSSVASSKADSSATSIPPLEITHVDWCDSISSQHNSAVCRLSVDNPEGATPAAIDSMRLWIATELEAPAHINLSNIVNILTHTGQNYLHSVKVDLDDMDEYRHGMQFVNQIDINLIYHDSKVATLLCTQYEYTGGAHGDTAVIGQTFDLSTGKHLGYNIFNPADSAQLRTLVADATSRQYFKSEPTSSTLPEAFVSTDDMPLPVNEPYMTADGLAFIYGQYEIAPYSSGMPTCVVPYDSLRPLVDNAYRDLLP